MSRFQQAVEAIDVSSEATSFDIPVQIDPESTPFAVRFRVTGSQSELKQVEQEGSAFAKSFEHARMDANIPEEVRKQIPLEKKVRDETFRMIGKLQATQMGVVELKLDGQGQVTGRTLTDEKVTDEEWIWLQHERPYTFKYVTENWGLCQVTKRDAGLIEEVESQGKSLSPAIDTAGSSQQASSSGDAPPVN